MKTFVCSNMDLVIIIFWLVSIFIIPGWLKAPEKKGYKSFYQQKHLELQDSRKTKSLDLKSETKQISNKDLLENLLQKNQNKSPHIKERSVLLSAGFLIPNLLTLTKSMSTFFFGENLKEIGLYFIKNDTTVTFIALITSVLNLFIRFNMGALYDLIGLKKLFLLNTITEILSSLILVLFAEYTIGFLAFAIIWRCSNGRSYLYRNLTKRNALYSMLRDLFKIIRGRFGNATDEVFWYSLFFWKLSRCCSQIYLSRR